MKTRFILKSTLCLFILSMAMVSCKKDDNPPDPADFQSLSFDTEAVMDKLPNGLTNSSDEYAQSCVDMVESALDMSGFIDQMDVPSNATRVSKKASSDTWSWTWSDGAQTYTFYWTYSEDNSKHYWTMEIQFGGGTKYPYIEAWEYKDGSGGQVIYNFNWAAAYYGEEDYIDLFWTYNWSVDSSGNYEFSMTYDSSELDYDYYLEYYVVVNDDGSGSVDYYISDQHYYHMEWDASGAGSWTWYLGDGTLTGTWDAA